MTVEYHPLTVSDLNNAVTYYNQQRADLGDEFRSEVFAAIERVRLNPLRFAVVEHEIRRCLVHRFPYSVLFRLVNDQTIRILVIRHHRRYPSFGYEPAVAPPTSSHGWCSVIPNLLFLAIAN